MDEQAPPREWPKTCRCGQSFDEDGWNALKYVGVDRHYALEFRNCVCGSTLAMPSLPDSKK